MEILMGDMGDDIAKGCLWGIVKVLLAGAILGIGIYLLIKHWHQIF